MFNISFDEVREFATLLMLELIFSFTAVFLLIGSVLLFCYDYLFFGVLTLILGLFCVMIFVGLVRVSLL